MPFNNRDLETSKLEDKTLIFQASLVPTKHSNCSMAVIAWKSQLGNCSMTITARQSQHDGHSMANTSTALTAITAKQFKHGHHA